MMSRWQGRSRRSVVSFVAAVVAASISTLFAHAASARAPRHASKQAVAASAGAKAPAKPHAETKKTAEKPSADKPSKKADNPSKKKKAHAATKASKATKAGAEKKAGVEKKSAKRAAPSSEKKSRKTAARKATSRRKSKGQVVHAAPAKPCFASPVTIDRGGLESQTVPLVDCKGKPVASTQRSLSVIARPWGTARPKELAANPKPAGKVKGKANAHLREGEIAPGVHLLDAGLLVRLQAVANKFPGRTISLVSGYRPQSQGSQHQLGRALDLRVLGVSNEDLVAFCKTQADTGCGYYPNSSFIHMDVRKPGTGVVTWIDASGPGEPPRYVKQWPLPQEEEPVVPPADVPPDALPDAPTDIVVDPWAAGAELLPPAGVAAPAEGSKSPKAPDAPPNDAEDESAQKKDADEEEPVTI